MAEARSPTLMEEAQNLLVARSEGVWLTAEGREMVLRALDEPAKTGEVERLRLAVEQARDTFNDLVLCLRVLRHPIAADACHLAATAMENALKESPAAPQDPESPPPPLPAESAGDVVQTDETLTPERVQRESDDDSAAMLAEEMGGACTEVGPVRWGRAGKEGTPWHAYRQADLQSRKMLRAVCNEDEATADPAFLLALADGVRPRAVEACVDCATLTGWDSPERMTMMEGPAAEVGTVQPTWGRVGEGPWHLFIFNGISVAVCSEAIDAPMVPRVGMEPMDPGDVCIDCSESGHPLALAYQQERDSKMNTLPKGEKKKRNTPETCVVEPCPNKGASRNQWCCPAHTKSLNLVERRAALEKWKKGNSAPAQEAANG